MKTVLITTADDPLNIFFWESFLEHRKNSISKIILLPSRGEVDFPIILKPLIAFRLLGILGIFKFGYKKIFSRKIRFDIISEECVVLNTLDSEILYNEVSRSNVDVLISVGAPVVFKDDLLSLPSICALNIHNGDIKRYRGHFSTFWEIINQEKKSVITIHEMTRKVDTGTIYDQSFIYRSMVASFWDLMVWKKIKGGEMLAKRLFTIENLEILKASKKNVKMNIKAKYYQFPKIKDVLKFRF